MKESAASRRSVVSTVTTTSRWDALWDYLTLNFVAVYFIGSLVLQAMISWLKHMCNDQRGNVGFFLYVGTQAMKELIATCFGWRSKQDTRNHKASWSSRESGGAGGSIGVPDLFIQRTFDESDDDTSLVSVTRDEEWFLSPRSFPSSTVEERKRFLKARNGEIRASHAILKNYLDWRAQFDEFEQHEPVLGEEDPVWSQACRMAYAVSSSSRPLHTIPPCIVFFPDKDPRPQYAPESLCTLDGKRVLVHLPARIDLSIADAQVYATALALYIDLQVPHDSMEKFCVVIDTRPGKGWSNIPAPKLVPFIKHTAHLLNDLHPERLDTCILFPVPSVAKFLWSAVRPFLDPATANKICILSGTSYITSPVPSDMVLHLSEEVVEWMEQKRLSTFVARRGKQ